MATPWSGARTVDFPVTACGPGSRSSMMGSGRIRQPTESLRGGAYRYLSREHRSAKQFWLLPDVRTSFTGLRLAQSIR